jgi:serine/threonine protein phosphatase PrpC
MTGDGDHPAGAPAPKSRRESATAVVCPRFDFRVDYAALSRVGRRHEINEDRATCRPGSSVFALADGMGGHRDGDQASRLAVGTALERLCDRNATTTLARYASDPKLHNRREVFRLLESALVAASQAVRDAGDGDDEKSMGSTLVAVLLVRDRAFIAHVGDSRVYLARPTATVQLTHDHSVYDELRTTGKRRPARLQRRSPLSNWIGAESPSVDTAFVDLTTSDRILLCSDGVHHGIDDEALLGKLCRQDGVGDACDRLVSEAIRRDGTDDASAILLHIGDRFVKRRSDRGPRGRDLEVMASTPLLVGLSTAQVLSTIAAGIEIELDTGDEVPNVVASDRVAYLILEGLVKLPSGRLLGPSGMLLAESLVDEQRRDDLPVVEQPARLLRIRHDDFVEVCSHEPRLAAALYKRLARHLARS